MPHSITKTTPPNKVITCPKSKVSKKYLLKNNVSASNAKTPAIKKEAESSTPIEEKNTVTSFGDVASNSSMKPNIPGKEDKSS